MREVRKWIAQAEADLKAAEDSLKSGHYDWACFQSQQSAEKGLKAFLYSRGNEEKLAELYHRMRSEGFSVLKRLYVGDNALFERACEGVRKGRKGIFRAGKAGKAT